MDPYDSPLRSLIVAPIALSPHSLLRTRERRPVPCAWPSWAGAEREPRAVLMSKKRATERNMSLLGLRGLRV